MRPLLALALLLAACETGSVALKDDTAANADDTGAPDTGDTADTDDTDDTDDTVPPVSAWSGDWPGTITLEIEDPRGGTFTLCEGDAALVVTDDGAFSGDGLCETDMGPGDIAATFDGALDDAGNVTGIVTLRLLNGDVDYDLEGLTEPGGLSFSWSGEITSPDGQVMPLLGSFSG